MLGSILNSRYQQTLTPALTHYRIPESILHLITGSLGGALIVAQELGGAAGSELAAAARHAFISGMDLAVTVAAVVVGMAAIVAAILLPSRAPDLTGQASEAESGKTDGQIEDPSPISPNQGR